MTRWVIFAPRVDNDEALENAFWIAAQTRSLSPPPARFVHGRDASRFALDEALRATEAPFGLALFGHGDDHAVYGADDEPALDAENLAGEWVHAFACRTGVTLAREAEERGVSCFVGYGVSLLVGWSLGDLAPELLARLSKLVTATTDALLRGARTRAEIQRRVSSEADALVDWINAHAPDEHLGLCVLADMLVDRVVVVGNALR